MHDPLTVALCVAPDLVETELMRVDIEVQSPLTRGMTMANRVDGVRFAQLSVDTVAGPAAAVRGG